MTVKANGANAATGPLQAMGILGFIFEKRQFERAIAMRFLLLTIALYVAGL